MLTGSKKLETIKGVALTAAAIIVAETQGFALISNRKQLASHAGLGAVQRPSGSSVCGKTGISKKGNSGIRAALYMPAIVASAFNPQFKEDYIRILQKHPKQKKIAITAIQRKLLLLIYAIWKNGESYDPKKQTLPGMRRWSSSFVLGDSPKKQVTSKDYLHKTDFRSMCRREPSFVMSTGKKILENNILVTNLFFI